jgi:hypothetical protein
MKAYLLITGTMFTLIGGAHLIGLFQKWDWTFDGVLGVTSACFALWAFWLTATTARKVPPA